MARIFLAGALYQLNSSRNSQEMLFLSDYYLQHYYDQEFDELRVDLSGDYGRSATVLGLLLWEVGYEYFALNDLATYNIEWLIAKD
ncbi:MAG: hypothetical protein JXA54_13610 [Candidatus Heimdallarchaeota archaeon]|nr:hypothetical protein [Candidatus Heimdallarchaeota archaeon]